VSARRTYQVKDVSRLARVSVRTLHYYEEIGLLVPARRTDAGYRLYSDDDLLRLQQILIGRELGLPLEEIRRLLDNPAFDRRQALIAQKQQLQRRAEQTAGMIAAVDAALAMLDSTGEGGDMENIFEGFDAARYDAEARERWGETDAYKEAARRTKRYTKEDWARHRAEQEAIYRDAAALMTAGRAPSDDEAMAVAERHRVLIDRWFYPCSLDTHRGLASLYGSDPRFAAGIDAHAPGLTAFLVAAIRANANRTPIGPPPHSY
jgi:MerR family transcriptional regulator, thiopeptide resistance regulator